ncbi:hypothetical protein [Pedobacter ureilyticus]|uniref:Lipoprotein n=1 Tax=Pedobacter ureilyticus TaxID=1393051 RepID=A0ABW9J5S0_9SPHI|nr:hypothetical protein [Pedobacter helvus]
MKKIILLVAMIITVMACDKSATSIKVSKTIERYELLAEYPNRKEKRLKEYLKVAFGNDSLLLNEGVGAGKEVKLASGTVFYLRHNPNKLEIEMLKEKNSTKGYQFFDEMASGIKKALN